MKFTWGKPYKYIFKNSRHLSIYYLCSQLTSCCRQLLIKHSFLVSLLGTLVWLTASTVKLNYFPLGKTRQALPFTTQLNSQFTLNPLSACLQPHSKLFTQGSPISYFTPEKTQIFANSKTKHELFLTSKLNN